MGLTIVLLDQRTTHSIEHISNLLAHVNWSIEGVSSAIPERCCRDCEGADAYSRGSGVIPGDTNRR